MTIGNGALATSEPGRAKNVIPDHLILVSDTMGSFGDEYSHPRLHKSFRFPENCLYGVGANQIDRAAELMALINKHVAQTPIETRGYTDIIKAVAMACFVYKVERFTQTILPKHRMPPDVFDPLRATKEVNEILQPEWETFDVGCDLLVGAFNSVGQAVLLSVDGREGTMETRNFPGFWSIGTGGPNALFWMSHRKHHLGMTPLIAAYHAYEAKLMAEDSPNVNEELDVTVATSQDHWWFSSHPTRSGDKPHEQITFDTLKSLFKKYGPRDTSDIG